MSQNRTVIQGLEPDNGQGGNNMNSGLGNSFYSRSGRQAARGTVVPGMMGNETLQDLVDWSQVQGQDYCI